MNRTSVKIKDLIGEIVRTPITVISESNYNFGRWFPFEKGDSKPPADLKYKMTSTNDRILFCPYCNEWTIFRKDGDRHSCTGWCRWSNTDEFHVKAQNRLWGSSYNPQQPSKKGKNK